MDETERIERRLKLHDLRVLMSAVDEGSMAKAAQRLATSQPAVSRTIADLEHSLGVRLLDRGPRGIAPTPYGRALIERSITVFDEPRLGVKDLEFLADPTRMRGFMRAEARLGRSVELMYQAPRTNYFRSCRRKYEIVHKGRVELRLMFLSRGG